MFVSFGVCIYVQYFFYVVRNKTFNRKYLPGLIKRRSVVHQKNMSRERASHFGQLNNFSEAYKSLVYKIIKNGCLFFAEFIQT